MSLALEITVVSDTATPALRRLVAGLAPARINPVVGRSARNLIRSHLFGLNASRPNWLGGPRTNFFTKAGRATQFQIVGDSVIVSINQVGMQHQYYGGTIRPKVAKFLTIPVHPRAHGKRAREFDLELVYGLGGEPYALATKSTLVSVIRQTRGGRITRTLGGRRGEIMFRLVKKVTKQPDPTVLPPTPMFVEHIKLDLEAYFHRLIGRQGGVN